VRRDYALRLSVNELKEKKRDNGVLGFNEGIEVIGIRQTDESFFGAIQ